MSIFIWSVFERNSKIRIKNSLSNARRSCLYSDYGTNQWKEKKSVEKKYLPYLAKQINQGQRLSQLNQNLPRIRQ